MNKINLFEYQVLTGRNATTDELIQMNALLEDALELKLTLLDLEERLLKIKPHLAKDFEEKKKGIDKMPNMLLLQRITTLKPYVEFHEKNNTIFIKRKNPLDKKN
jgi:hypothetical protein